MKNIIQRQNFESHVLRELRMVEGRLNLLHEKMGKAKRHSGAQEIDKTKKLISKTDLLVEVAQLKAKVNKCTCQRKEHNIPIRSDSNW